MSPPSSPSTTKPSSPLLPLPARFLASSHPSAGSGRVRLPAELGIALASAVRVRIDVVAKGKKRERETEREMLRANLMTPNSMPMPPPRAQRATYFSCLEI